MFTSHSPSTLICVSQRKQHYYATKIQATWRMYKKRRVYSRWGRRRLKIRRKFFQMWSLSYRFKARARLSVKRKYLVAWRDEVGVAIQLREIELKLFRDAEMQAELPKLVVNLVFTSTEHDDPIVRSAQRVTHQSSTIGTGGTLSFGIGGFFNSAFASVEQFPDSKKRRVQHIRVLHREARHAIVKKIVQRTFLLWKRVHIENKRVGLNAQLCIKRAARMAFGSRPVWAGEKLMLVFGIWCRWAAFSRCKRSGQPLPDFAQSLPQWDIWVFNHQERHVRKVKAAAKAPVARMHRYFHRLRRYSRQSIKKKTQLLAATTQYAETITRKILCSWREEIAEDAYNKKLCRSVLGRLRRYAHVKATLRPRKQAVARQKQLWDSTRAWRAWKGVHLRSFFKRELNVSKLEQSQWRGKVHRIVHIWMGAKHQVNRWRTFEAWRNLCRKRRLFQTLRFHCERVRKRHLLFGILNAWKAFVWKQEDEFLEDRLRLSAWDAYEELSPYFPKLFYGCYSAAAATFGGVEMEQESDDEGDTRGQASSRLQYNSDGIRHFQSIVNQGSVAEVRNTILQSKHLINAVDEATGNTPLHVVMQVEDPTHRNDVLSLLLSEGAATWHHANRHGLTPKQLAPNEDARLLLEKGVYEFYANKVLQLRLERNKKRSLGIGVSHDDDEQRTEACNSFDDQRLVWCMVTLMSSEWVRGERLAGDIKVREWHSVLEDELWLRQERIIFASTSDFSPTILRCRAFLNGMKKKLARSCDQILKPPASGTRGCHQRQDNAAPLPVQKTLSRALHSRGSLRGQQHIEMIARIVDASDKDKHLRATKEEEERMTRARMLGELEAYARFLLTPTLDCDLAEKDLVHSFVGVLYSLEFSMSEVLAEAYRLEDVCSALEQNVLTLHDALARAQWKVPSASIISPDPSLLCCFASELEMELYFEKELLYLRLAALMLDRSGGDGGTTHENEINAETPPANSGEENTATTNTQECEILAKELASLLTKLQRKTRKIEKKKKIVEDRIADAMTAYRAKLFAAVKSVRDICDARMALENARLRMAGVLLKHSELQKEVSSVEKMKAHLMSGEDLGSLSVQVFGADSIDAIQRRREFLQVELVKCRPPYRTKDLLANTEGGTVRASDVTGVGTLDVRRLHKEAKTALRLLFVANLFRCCCCWLAENMISPPPDNDVLDELDENRLRLIATYPVRAGQLPGPSRRRSSVSSSRKLVGTLHRGSVLAEAAERDAALMYESYANSVDMLFETERAELQEAEKLKLEELRGKVVEVIYEYSPITGHPEDPPEHLVDISLLQESSDTNAARDNERKSLPVRSRKKEELRKAIIEHQLKRVAGGDRHLDRTGKDRIEASLVDGGAATRGSQLPSVHGTVVEFGNFVACASPPHTPEFVVHAEPPSVGMDLSERNAEHMWKRGARTNDTGGQAASSIKGSAEAIRSSESGANFGTSFRVLSAARDRRAPSTRLGSAGKVPRLSDLRGDALPAGSDSSSGSAQAKVAVEDKQTTTTCAFESDDIATAGDGGHRDEDHFAGFVTPTSEEDQPNADGDAEFAVDGADLSATQLDEDVDVDAERSDLYGDDDTCAETTLFEVASWEIDPSLSEPAARGNDDEEDVLPTDSLEDHLLRMREDVERAASASTHSMPLISEQGRPGAERSHRNERQQPTPSGSDEAGDAFAAGSRFLAFIRWEKKDAALASALPHIFQDAPPRSPRAQEERDVRQAHKTANAKKKADAAACASSAAVAPAKSESSQVSRSICNPSALALQGKAAVLTGSRKRMASTNDGEQASGRSLTGPSDSDDVEVLAAIPRILVAVAPAPQPADPSESPGDLVPAPASPPSANTTLGIQAEMDISALVNGESGQEVLQLEGRAFARSASDANADAVPTTGDSKAESPTLKTTKKASAASRALSTRPFREPRGRRSTAAPIARQRSDAALAPLHLDGTKTGVCAGAGMVKAQSTSDVKTPDEKEPTLKLSAQQKQQVWDAFSSLPLSEGVQNAYAVVYPHLYTPTVASTRPEASEPNTSPADPHEATGDAGSLRRKLSSTTLRRDSQQSTSAPLALQLRALKDPRRSSTDRSALQHDRKFWSAVEGYKAIGAPTSVLALDATTVLARRREAASRIHDEFLHERSLDRLDWLDMYPHELLAVTTSLNAAPRSLFDALQQTAQLRISTALSQLRCSDQRE